MSATPLRIQLAGVEIDLLAERAAKIESTLLVADLHLGKDQAFRAMAVALPAGALEIDLRRLSNLIESTQAEELVVLGDFWHAQAGCTPAIRANVQSWLKSLRVPVRVVPGNHDQRPGFDGLALEVLPNRYERWGLALIHEPPVEGPAINGHLHPGVRIEGRAKQGIRLPAFLRYDERLILPAFGILTGLMCPTDFDRAYAIAENRVVEITYSRR